MFNYLLNIVNFDFLVIYDVVAEKNNFELPLEGKQERPFND